ncbi:hypothetical protein, partial [Rhodovulum sulfidophilum]|uniref:hypothetical protein n=1 Tax=Rhodovulum sulfidophilum TaxID=35806 RepID=UPI001EE46771
SNTASSFLQFDDIFRGNPETDPISGGYAQQTHKLMKDPAQLFPGAAGSALTAPKLPPDLPTEDQGRSRKRL